MYAVNVHGASKASNAIKDVETAAMSRTAVLTLHMEMATLHMDQAPGMLVQMAADQSDDQRDGAVSNGQA